MLLRMSRAVRAWGRLQAGRLYEHEVVVEEREQEPGGSFECGKARTEASGARFWSQTIVAEPVKL